MDVYSEVSKLQLHAAFPKVDIDTVNDILNQCNGDAAEARTHLASMFGGEAPQPRIASATPVKSPPQPARKPIPLGVVHCSPNRGVPKPQAVPAALFPKEIKAEDPKDPASREDMNRLRLDNGHGPNVMKGNFGSNASSGVQHSALLDLMNISLPVPPAKETTPTRRLARPGMFDSYGGFVPFEKPVPANNTPDLPPELQLLLQPPPNASLQPAYSAGFAPRGWDDDDAGEQENQGKAAEVSTPGTAMPISDADAASSASKAFVSSPIRTPAVKGLAAETGSEGFCTPDGKSSFDDAAATVEFLQSMFSAMDGGLVADVLHGVDNNTDAAIEKLMAVQASTSNLPLCCCAHIQWISSCIED